MISCVLKSFFRFQISSVKKVVENLNFSIANFETLEKPRSKKKLSNKSNINQAIARYNTTRAATQVRDGRSFVSRGKTDQWNCFPRNTKAVSGREREGPSLSLSLARVWSSLAFFSFFFRGREIAKKATLIQISGEKVPVLSKTSCQISPSFNIFGESVATGLSIGYTLNGPVQNCRQLSQNLPLEARHCCYITKLKKKKRKEKKNTLVQSHTLNTKTIRSHLNSLNTFTKETGSLNVKLVLLR